MHNETFFKNYYEVFDIPVGYKIDEQKLTKLYLEKQRKIHPDAQNDHDKIVDSLDSGALNVAYQTLIDPIKRAEYLLKLNKLDVDMISSKNALEMFEIRDKYESLSFDDDRKKFQEYLQKRMPELETSLYNLEEDIYEFREKFALLCFIGSFLEKIKLDVYSGTNE